VTEVQDQTENPGGGGDPGPQVGGVAQLPGAQPSFAG
jgi:hypothetical protein